PRPRPHGGPRHCLDAAAQRHPGLERGLLDHHPDLGPRRHADGLHLLLFFTAGPVPRQALSRLAPGHRAHPAHGLVQPETTRPRPDLRSGEMMSPNISVDTLPLVGRDQGWGLFGPNIRALAPPPTLPHQGGGAARWALLNAATPQPKDR